MTPTANASRPEAYTLLRAALALFKKAPSELADAELTQARRQAANEFEIETRVLNSQEASAVMDYRSGSATCLSGNTRPLR